MTNTLSSVSGLGTSDAVGFRQVVSDNQTFTDTQTVKDSNGNDDEEPIIITDESVDNIAYSGLDLRLDIVKPAQFKNYQAQVIDPSTGTMDAGNGFMKTATPESVTYKDVNSVVGAIELIYDYNAVYQNFDSQMQIGHVYGELRKEGFAAGVKSRLSDVYVVGNATAPEDMAYMKALSQYNIDNNVNDGTFEYRGVATYKDDLHLGDGDQAVSSQPTVDGTSQFTVDFISNQVNGNLDFASISKAVDINATIDGNTFTGNDANLEVAGGFYGEDAQFLGGIYQDTPNGSGTGTTPGTGTQFHGTFGAEKQPQ